MRVLTRTTTLCAVLLAASVAHAQPRPAEVAAETRRAEALARAAQLTVVQARAVFAQILPAPFVPSIRAVTTDSRPDGTRNIFGLMDVDPRRECSTQGLRPGDCGNQGVQTWVFFTQVSADGRVLQTGYDVPFSIVSRGPSTTRAVGLRLFAPSSPSEPRVVLIDGVKSGRQSYQHQIWIWDGRRGYGILGASSLMERGPDSGGADLMSIALDEPGHRIVATSLECARACPCTVPRTPVDEAAQVARLVRAHPTTCITRERVFPFPRGLRLIDEDLDARAPQGTESELAAAVVPDLVRASGLTRPQAEAVLTRLRSSSLFVPHFSRFVTTTNRDGSRVVHGLIETRQYDMCIVRRRERSLYDAARACAGEMLGSNMLVSIDVSASGEVTAARVTPTSGEPVAIHLVRDATGAVTPVVESLPSRSLQYNPRAFDHRIEVMGGPDNRHREPITDAHFVGELVARPAGGVFVTLIRRRTTCSAQCPCDPMPQSQAEEHAFLAARASNAACPVEEAPLPLR